MTAHASADAVRLDAHGLWLGERALPLYCGALHYWRMAPAHWRRALEELRDLGMTMVETYVPWGIHEHAPRQYDFGERNPSLDVAAFIDLAAELGLYVFLRPGPNVNAELGYFGLPKRVVFDPECQAVSARGMPVPLPVPPRAFPVPSYASRRFRVEAEHWLRAVGAIAAPRCYPRGPIVLAQVDNEAAFYFRDAPYDSDYHPDAIADFHAFLRARYGTPDALARVYGEPVESFESVEPPRRFRAKHSTELAPYLDWVAFQEQLVCDALAQLGEVMRDAGFGGVPFVHNVPMGEGGLATSLTSVGRAVDLVGIDYYHGRRGLEAVRRRTQRLAGCASPAFAPELGFGAPPWFPLRTDADSITSALTACAYGLRGFNLYMTVDRDRWYGAPLDGEGAPRASAEVVQRFIGALDRTRHAHLRRPVQVALSIPSEYARMSRATHAFGALSPSALEVAGLPPTSTCRNDRFGFARPVQLAWHALLLRLDEALCDEHVPFVYVESETDLDRHPELRVVFAPSYELADPARFERLARFAARGGTVVYGPDLPHLDAQLLPHGFAPLSTRPTMQIEDLTSAKMLVRELCDELELVRPFPVEPQPLRSAVHVDESGKPRVLFLVHPGEGDVIAEVHVGARLDCEDAMTRERWSGGATAISIPMSAHSCRMLVLEDAP